MLKSQLKIVYTSDVHGQLTSTDYARGKKGLFGLSRLKTFLTQNESEIVLMDNGDILQGSVLLDYDRKTFNMHPTAIIMNHLGYHYTNIGNHDFNYGYDYFIQYQKRLHAKVICSNIVDHNDQPFFEPYIIHQAQSGIRIGIIAAITPYVPMWEKAEHIKGLFFKSAKESVSYYVKKIIDETDAIIVLYHGGFEKHPITGEPIGRKTTENEGFELMQINGIDVLLTGHQHVPQVYRVGMMTIMQTGYMATDFGCIDLIFERKGNNQWVLIESKPNLIKMDMESDVNTEALLEPLEKHTQAWLDQKIGHTIGDWKSKDPLSLRVRKHPLIQLINDLQRKLAHADISCASLPNEAFGFGESVTLRDLAANFVYPNTFVKLKVNGRIIKAALERTAEYFSYQDNRVVIDPSFLYPKCEHYNVDIYEGITYTIDPKKPKGNRIVQLDYLEKPLADETELTLVLNNYRAIGGGDYPMFKDAILLDEFDVTLFDLVKKHIEQHPVLDIVLIHNFHVLES